MCRHLFLRYKKLSYAVAGTSTNRIVLNLRNFKFRNPIKFISADNVGVTVITHYIF